MRKTIVEKRDIQRKTVLDAAAKLFAERGFGGTSLVDVARDLSISRPALYYYFSSKEEILSSLVDEISVKSQRLIEGIMEKDTDPVSKLHEMTYNQLLFVMRNKLPFMVVVKTEEELVSETRKLNLESKKAVLDGFQAVIQSGIDDGHFRKMDAAVAALGIIGMCSWCAFWFKDGGRIGETAVAEQLTTMALSSVIEADSADGMRDEIGQILDDLDKVSTGLTALQKKY